ncbi:MAG: PEP-CTERM sorting domain-containing protein [Planctomycetota bacterium]|jgi:hypothetical protein
MKKFAVCTITVLFAAVNCVVAVPAGVIVCDETIDVYEVLDGRLPGPPVAQWQHNCDISADLIDSATLTIVAEGVDSPDELDPVWFNGHFLGNLDQQGFEYDGYDILAGPGALGHPQTELTTTVFTLEPSWIETLNDVSVQVGTIWIVEVETSTLAVTVIPEPGTIFLLGLGSIYLAKNRRFLRGERQ